MVTAKKKQRTRRDRLSDLPDCILGHILSFLPTQEAGRAAILSRRWRRAFADVHTISFEVRIDDPSSVPSYDDDRVTAALLSRRRSGGVDAPLHSLRIDILYSPSPSDFYAVDQWLSYALRRSLQELFLRWAADEDACRRCYILADDDSSDSESDTDSSWSESDVDQYAVPAKLYSCATVRALHLVSCSLRTLRSTSVDLPSLETLSLSRIRYSRSVDNIHRLIAGCPRLADLTLEACSRIRDLTVPPNVRLRRLALLCCHGLRRVTVDLSETRTLEYRDVRPDASCFTLVGHGKLQPRHVSCQASSPRKIDFEKLMGFLFLLADTTSLQLQLPDTKNYVYPSDDFFADFPLFQNLTRLELGSRLRDRRIVAGVPGILRQTPNLNTLSLKLCGPRKCRKTSMYHRNFAVDEVPDASAPCLRERVRELSVEQYEGANVQRMLLKSLLRGALVLETVRVVFANGRHSVLDQLMDEITSWSRNPATTISFS